MNSITKLYNDLQINLSFDEIKGEVSHTENEIIWKYDLSMKDNESEPYYDDEYSFNFKPSVEEELNDVYNCDIDIIENLIDGVSDLSLWEISESEIDDETISFKIMLK